MLGEVAYPTSETDWEDYRHAMKSSKTSVVSGQRKRTFKLIQLCIKMNVRTYLRP